MNENELSKEERILRAVRQVIVDVIKDTATQPGLKHPLTENTRNEMRYCLQLITARQAELADAEGRPFRERPRYPDQPKKSVTVTLASTTEEKR